MIRAWFWRVGQRTMLGISPVENFAFLIGPYLDLGLSGTPESRRASEEAWSEPDARPPSYAERRRPATVRRQIS
jgi:hypothetical protein